MMRLTVLSQSPVETVLAVDGWLVGTDVAFLEQEGKHWLQESRRLVLDLRGVQFIDRRGIALFQDWVGEGVVLRGAIPFIEALLAAHGLGQEQCNDQAVRAPSRANDTQGGLQSAESVSAGPEGRARSCAGRCGPGVKL